MVMVSARHRFAYVAIPKTGSSSIVRHLTTHYGAVAKGRHHSAKCKVPSGCLCWTAVRNPWVRLISWWDAWTFGYVGVKHPPNDKPSHTCTFAEFITFLTDNRECKDPMTRHIRYPQHMYAQQQPCTRLIHIENLEEEFAALPFAGKAPFGKRQNVGSWRNRGAPRDFYAQDGALEAADRYGMVQECESLGYPKEIPE